MPRHTRRPTLALLVGLLPFAPTFAGGPAAVSAAEPTPASPAAPAAAAAVLEDPALDGAALILVANGDDGGVGHVETFRGDGAELPASNFRTGYTPDAQIAAGNLLGTRESLELAVAFPFGEARIFDLTTGTPIDLNFDVTFDDGDLMAAGDVDNDGVDELLIANDKEAGGGGRRRLRRGHPGEEAGVRDPRHHPGGRPDQRVRGRRRRQRRAGRGVGGEPGLRSGRPDRHPGHPDRQAEEGLRHPGHPLRRLRRQRVRGGRRHRRRPGRGRRGERRQRRARRARHRHGPGDRQGGRRHDVRQLLGEPAQGGRRGR